MAQLTLKNITKSFAGTDVLKGVSLDVEDGEFVSLVGQSGCGKSTLLRIIAGLETPDSGEILIDGLPVTQKAPKDRNIAMVFQDYALYPHMSVAQNMSMPLIMSRVPLYARLPLMSAIAPASRKEMPAIHAEVEKVAKQLRIDHLLTRRPAQLSGGQRQRVALGRALVRNPQVFLMDEPLSNLDAKLRVRVRQEISELHASSGLTFVYVTHDQVEAMTMSDRVALMQNGKFLQVGAPNELYTDPANVDVARFIGSPEINIIPAKHSGDKITFAGVELPQHYAGLLPQDVHIGIRPDAISVSEMHGLTQPNVSTNSISVLLKKRLVEDLGGEVLIHGHLSSMPEQEVRIRAQKSSSYGQDNQLARTNKLQIKIDPSSVLFFDEHGQRQYLSTKAPATARQLAGVE